MDDHNTRQQIKELADLYLTSIIDESGDTPSDDVDAQSPLEGPEPIRLSPKLDTPAPYAEGLTLAEQEELQRDSHPMLRLTDADNESAAAAEPLSAHATDTATATEPPPPAPDAREPAPRAVLEAVIMGNLPGMSGPWLTQYAQLLAQTEGPVAILHVMDGAIDLELVEPRAEAEPAPLLSTSSVRIPPMRGNKTGLVGLLDALVCSEKSPTRTVLVRMEDATADAQTLSRLAAMDDWTLLCGSDDMSIAGATQQLRTMVRADPRLADRNVGLMVMGSDEAAARSAANRVAQDLAQDLANPVEFIGHLKRMQPVQVRDIGTFPDPVGVWPQLVSWFDSLEPPEPIATPAPSATPPASEPDTPRPGLSPVAEKIAASAASTNATNPAGSRPSPMPSFRTAPPRTRQAPAASTAAPQPTPAAATDAPRMTQPAPQPPRAAAAATPGPAAATQPMRPAPQKRVLQRAAELDLVALLGQGPAALDSPTSLEARIPDQPDAQLAVDAHGTVHILARHDAALDDRQAVMQLIEAGRWVSDNLELLALTRRELTFADDAPVLHLLTDRAQQATRLVGKLSGQVNLHLLQQVQIGRESGWFCTPLG